LPNSVDNVPVVSTPR